MDCERTRVVFNRDASKMHLNKIPHGTIITSPPYMRSLTYARDFHQLSQEIDRRRYRVLKHEFPRYLHETNPIEGTFL